MNTQPTAGAPVAYQADSHGGFFTTSLFWDCQCEDEYIHPYSQVECPVCGARREQAPDSHVDEVICQALEWQLDPDLVRQVAEAIPYGDPDLEADEGPLVEQYENASRMHDDDWMDAAYEDGVSGWSDDF